MTEQRDSTLNNQQKASDPQASSWVSANAGCGKTHVLVNRLIRLLLAGESLGGIVSLTYTRAAASEMKARLYQRLGEWQHEKDEQILTDLREISGLQAEKMNVSVARGLLRHVLQQREGVRIQTIHSFCHHLLARFPIEAGLGSSGFDIIEDFEAARLEKKAFDTCIDNIASGKRVDLQEHLAEIALGKAEGDVRTVLAQARRQLPEVQADQQQTLARLTDEFLAQDEQLRDKRLKQDKDEQTKTTDKDEMARWFQASRTTRRAAMDGGLPLWDDYRQLFLTTTGTARKTKDDVLLAHQELVLDWIEKRKAYYRDSPSLALVARHFDGLYQRLKADNGKLDYDDLIDKTLALLEQDGGVNWVTYKLDQGIEHILVDEAQDTAPRQWQLIHALSQDFFAGEGTHENPRTIFAVGDFKQSIYGFQGAEPQGFRRAQAYYEQRVPSMNFRTLEFRDNFRSSKAILKFVDKVMTVSGVNLGIEDIPPHQAKHDENRGLVEIWERYEKPQVSKPNYQESWVRQDIEADTPPTPKTTAQLIAEQVKGLLDSGDRLDTTGKPIQAGDIMLLFRARNELYRQVIQELHRHKVPIAGMDRLQLQDDLAIMDLCALAQWVLLPRDDFTLACLLKSPLCGIDEDALQKLALGREKQLWQVLQASKEHTDACAFLKDMLRLADTAPPFEFFQRVLAHHGKRQAFYEAQGVECGDILDELLNAALSFERTMTPSLQGFLDWFNQDAIKIKRDMESQHNKVRLLTIHGAKGLEAPIVILASSHWQDRSKKASEPTRRNGKLVWHGVQENMDEDSKKDDEQQKQEGYKEDNRLLYVALTRAKERLYIAGYDQTDTDIKKDDEWLEQKDNGDNAPPRRYCVLTTAFESLQQELEAGDLSLDKGDDKDFWLWRLRYEPKHKKKTPVEEAKKDEHVTLPPWAVAPPRKVGTPETAEETQAKQDKARYVLSPLQEDQAVQRGNAVHHVLERLSLDAANKTPDERDKMIHRLLGDYVGDKDEIAQKIEALFIDPTINALLARPCQREVSLMDGEGDTLAVHRIDRLIIEDNKILIIDYKSDADPPTDSQKIPQHYRDQLRRYRDKMQALYPDLPCEGYLLWTSTARLMQVC